MDDIPEIIYTLINGQRPREGCLEQWLFACTATKMIDLAWVCGLKKEYRVDN